MDCFFRNYHEALLKCTKPYQYVGEELFSYNKDFDTAKVKFAIAFPDKYEIGISNLGVRILYDLINRQKNYMCDRVYAPEKDFNPEPLYALESKKALKDFDAIAFSLQYEMSYPTVLKMLEMSDVPYKNTDRTDNDPIIIAGGPCAYNPLPLSEFIDVFMIGDGEESIIEICEILEKTSGMPREDRIKELCKGENCGRWSALTGGKVKKRISQLTYESALKTYPIPFSSAVHDRAVVEIRRGCGRMCRFCQPGHVTLPVRERPAEDIIKITKELVKNTGYDEYSLLSLSSNDYSNIKEVIKELAVDFDKKKVSVSLPSQRIDGFSLELANLMQSVRKSTMTLAPEAGSQRLRDVIKKNINEEQILNAVLTLYENGWTKLKFYFICGLPSENISDLDEMALLLDKIKYRTKLIKKEKGLQHGLDLTCTLSIFVPKPFTPFQWCGQMSTDKINEHINYLKEKTSHIKGLKINYHDKYVSLLEAVLTRGNADLCRYIEALYRKGCYLDAWGEYFNKELWYNTAEELGIDLFLLAEKNYDLSEELPWDFIDTGIDKKWLVEEYKKAFNATGFQTVCERQCVNCGVCKNLKTRKILAKPYLPNSQANEKAEYKNPASTDTAKQNNERELFRYRIKLTKTGILKYFSHLDWQNTFFKALSRSGLNVAFSMGYNPSMKVSMGVALPLFAESLTEFVDVELLEDTDIDIIKEKLTRVLPKQSQIISIVKIPQNACSIDTTVCWAEYKIEIFNKSLYDFETLRYNTEKVLSSREIFIEKKNKKGLIKKTDVKSSVKSYRYENDTLFIVLKTGQSSDIAALRADVLMNIIAPDIPFNITRTRFYDKNLKEL